ncbi:DNA replication protein [Acinetobacter wuhouensis]|uniref:phage/plasmid replication protein, II/X family n=1 Tax=Acinetobacter wuhouensis TaxID=1879050 RepID=UPI001023D369|nr:phage/plasmid replication protein, II/X family [Acinetobacter wuhouensis]RZG66673.1 DNA replication protein [Acinetobacter wuhouensis]
MLDKIVLWIPIDASLVDTSDDGRYSIYNFDLLDLGLKVGSHDVFKDEEGNVRTQVLHHAWSKIPTSHTKMSFKLFHEGYNHPFVELKCSPAKIMQGHNVYGTDWIEEGAVEMLGYFAESEPTLYGMCHIGGTEVKLLDATYAFRFKDDREAEKVRELLRNVSTQHIRKSTKESSFKNTVYFGSERGKRYKRKAYVKGTEFKEQLEEQIKLAKANDLCAQRVVKVMSCPELQKWATGLLRFETGITAYVMKEQGIPTNLFELIRYQRANPTLLQDQWLKANHQLFKAFEGTNVKVSDHETVFKNILAVHKIVSTEKKVCTRKVDELMKFYLLLESDRNLVKQQYSAKRYLNLSADLIDIGFSPSVLQRLHENPLKNTDHITVYAQLLKSFKKEIPAGTVSDRKARNIEKFYYDLERFGFEEMKAKYKKSQFSNLVASLIKCGYSKVYLQNLHVQSVNNVIPFINMFEMKFDQQLPENFVEPVSTFNKRQLKLVS